VILKSLSEAKVVAGIVESLDAAGNLERTREAGDDVAIALAVEFDLAGFVLHELGLVAAFDRPQFVRAATGQDVTRKREREQADQEEDSEDYVEETDSSEFFVHAWFWRYNRRQVSGVTERRCSASGYYCRAAAGVSTCFNSTSLRPLRPLRLCVKNQTLACNLQ